MNFRHLAFIVSLSTYATGNVDANLCVDSVLKFMETKKGQKQTCTDNKLKCGESPTFRSHCKEKCDNYYCCEDSKMPYLEVQPPKGGPIVWKPCAKLKKYCSKVPDVESACPVTCKKCVPHSISDMLRMIDLNAATNKAAFEEQGAIISKQETTITDLKDSVRDLATRYRFGGYEYLFASQFKTWAEHNMIANEWGGHLASAHSNEESIFMMSLARNYRQWVFIDGVRIDGIMVNTDGSAFDYINWYNAPNKNVVPYGEINMMMLSFKKPGWHNQDGMGMMDVNEGRVFPAIYKREFKYL